jgi:hypothetical protein
MKAVAPALALFAAIFALATPGTAAADTMSVPADVNGDGVMDRVSVSTVDGNPNAQTLAVKVGRLNYVKQIPMDNFDSTVQQPRITDINQDGRAEILVTDSIGANTLGLSVWVVDGGLHQVTWTETQPLRVWESSSFYNVDGYRCADGKLVTVRGSSYDSADGTFVGAYTTYDLHGRTATMVSSAPVSGPRSAFWTDPKSCA